jgi:superfamily II DNA/RNA helicase
MDRLSRVGAVTTRNPNAVYRGCITFAQTQCVQRFTRAHADVVVQAPTGSGKTFAYALPLIEHVRTAVGKRVPLKHDVRAHAKNSCVLSVRAQIYALVLVPNRELAIQVERVIKPLATVAGLTSVAFVGGAGTPLQRDVQRFADNGCVRRTRVRVEDFLCAERTSLLLPPGVLPN